MTLKAFIKPFEAPQWSGKIKFQCNFYFNTPFWNARGGKGLKRMQLQWHKNNTKTLKKNNLKRLTVCKCSKNISSWSFFSKFHKQLIICETKLIKLSMYSIRIYLTLMAILRVLAFRCYLLICFHLL